MPSNFAHTTMNKATYEVVANSPITLRGMTDPAVAVFLLLYTALFCYATRSSLSPGGRLQKHVKKLAEKEGERRSRRVLSLLQDPFLSRDLESMLESSLNSKELAQEEIRARREVLEKRLNGGAQKSDNNDDNEGVMDSFTYAKLLCQEMDKLNMCFFLTLVLIPCLIQEVWSFTSSCCCFFFSCWDSRRIVKRFGGQSFLSFRQKRTRSILKSCVSVLKYWEKPPTGTTATNVTAKVTTAKTLSEKRLPGWKMKETQKDLRQPLLPVVVV